MISPCKMCVIYRASFKSGGYHFPHLPYHFMLYAFIHLNCYSALNLFLLSIVLIAHDRFSMVLFYYSKIKFSSFKIFTPYLFIFISTRIFSVRIRCLWRSLRELIFIYLFIFKSNESCLNVQDSIYVP